MLTYGGEWGLGCCLMVKSGEWDVDIWWDVDLEWGLGC